MDNKEIKNEHRPEIFSGDDRYRTWFDCGNGLSGSSELIIKRVLHAL